MRHRLHIDWTACDGRGLCTELLPELLGRDDWGYPVLWEGHDPVIPLSLRSVARRAVAQCPRLALSLITE
jgi:ferredoxin